MRTVVIMGAAASGVLKRQPVRLIRHCERSGAFQRLMRAMLDCFVAFSGRLATADRTPPPRLKPRPHSAAKAGRSAAGHLTSSERIFSV